MSSSPHAHGHAAHRPSTAARLSTAIAAVPLPTFHLPHPAPTRQNLPHPATPAPAQNEPTAPQHPTRRWIRRLMAAASDPAATPDALVRHLHADPDYNPPPPQPAQTCHSLPQPATPHRAPAQNEPTFDPRTSLTPRQRHAARLLVAGHTATSVAALLGLNRHTISDWKKRPDFQAEIDHHLRTTNP